MRCDVTIAAQAMADQGSGGAYEISQRMTAMVGWGATARFREDWTWDQAAETYALDKDMAEKLRKSNPQVMLARSPVLSALQCVGGGVYLRRWGQPGVRRLDRICSQEVADGVLRPSCKWEVHQVASAGLQAFRNVVRRMLEASGRGMWNASQDKLEELQSMLNDIEDKLEGVQ